MTITAALENPFDLFSLLFAQRALVAVLLLAVIAAAIGWAIVLRDLPFFTHAVGPGAYPVLVLGVLAGVSIAVSAMAGALVFSLVSGTRCRCRSDARRRDQRRAARRADRTWLLLLRWRSGAVLAATAGSSDSLPRDLAGGPALRIAPDDRRRHAGCFSSARRRSCLQPHGLPRTAGSPAGLTRTSPGTSRLLAATWRCSRAWRSGLAPRLPVTGSLLAGALLIIPAATARMLSDRARHLPPLVFVIAAFEGVLGLYLSLNFDLPTGAAIAAVAGLGFFAAAGVLALRRARGPLRPVVSIALVDDRCGRAWRLWRRLDQRPVKPTQAGDRRDHAAGRRHRQAGRRPGGQRHDAASARRRSARLRAQAQGSRCDRRRRRGLPFRRRPRRLAAAGREGGGTRLGPGRSFARSSAASGRRSGRRLQRPLVPGAAERRPRDAAGARRTDQGRAVGARDLPHERNPVPERDRRRRQEADRLRQRCSRRRPQRDGRAQRLCLPGRGLRIRDRRADRRLRRVGALSERAPGGRGQGPRRRRAGADRQRRRGLAPRCSRWRASSTCR